MALAAVVVVGTAALYVALILIAIVFSAWRHYRPVSSIIAEWDGQMRERLEARR